MAKIVSAGGKASSGCSGQSVQGSSWSGLGDHAFKECRSTIMKSLFSTEPVNSGTTASGPHWRGSGPHKLAPNSSKLLGMG
jgi:hypothetical protein